MSRTISIVHYNYSINYSITYSITLGYCDGIYIFSRHIPNQAFSQERRHESVFIDLDLVIFKIACESEYVVSVLIVTLKRPEI